MEKIAKNTKRGTFIMKYKRIMILLLTISTFLLSGCGKKKETRQMQEPAPKEVLQPQTEIEEETQEISPPVITYLVSLSGNVLSLFEVNGEMHKLITSMEINPELYPSEDIEKLKKGIEAYCKEDGYAILENFVN